MHGAEGEDIAGEWKQLDAGSKPDADGAPQGNEEVRAERMAGRFAREQVAQGGVFFRSESEVVIVGIENGGDTSALFGGVEGGVGNVAEMNFLPVQFPGNQIAIAHAVEPGTAPNS